MFDITAIRTDRQRSVLKLSMTIPAFALMSRWLRSKGQAICMCFPSGETVKSAIAGPQGQVKFVRKPSPWCLSWLRLVRWYSILLVLGTQHSLLCYTSKVLRPPRIRCVLCWLIRSQIWVLPELLFKPQIPRFRNTLFTSRASPTGSIR